MGSCTAAVLGTTCITTIERARYSYTPYSTYSSLRMSRRVSKCIIAVGSNYPWALFDQQRNSPDSASGNTHTSIAII